MNKLILTKFLEKFFVPDFARVRRIITFFAMAERKEIITFVKKRAAIKRKITMCIRSLDVESCDENSVAAAKTVVSNSLKDILVLNESISDCYTLLEDEDSEELSEEFLKELDGQSQYSLDVEKFLNSCSLVPNVDKPAHIACDLKLPKLDCGIFTGEGKSTVDFFNFIENFKNIIGSRLNISGSTKLTYLKSYLQGYAAKVVQHLNISDSNFEVAIQLLEREFLDLNNLTSELFSKLLKLYPKFDQSFLETKIFVNEVRCIISDLKNYGTDLMENESCLKFVSHIIMNKLPKIFCQELARKLDNNYPTLVHLFDYYSDVINTLNLRGPAQVSVKPKAFSHNKFSKPHIGTNQNSSGHVAAVSVGEKKSCKFCGGDHSMYKCVKYPNLDSRISRCRELKLCTSCTSTRHIESSCPKSLEYACNICSQKTHIAALCPKMKSKVSVYNTCVSTENFLPTVTVKLCSDLDSVFVRFLVDTGATRSHISTRVSENLLGKVLTYDTEINVSTYLGFETKQVAEVILTVDLFDGTRKFQLPFIVDPNFSLKY